MHPLPERVEGGPVTVATFGKRDARQWRAVIGMVHGTIGENALPDRGGIIGALADRLDAIQGVLNRYDLLVTPTLASLPVDNTDDGNTMGPTTINGEEVDPLIGWCLTYFINFSGHPAASIPAGLSDDNLPVGMQIIGRRYADADVLAASAAFERLRPWQDTYRICAKRAL